MSEYQILTVFAAFAFAYSLIASRLEKTPINGAMVYLTVGVLSGPQVLGLIDLSIGGEGVSRLAEIALAIGLVLSVLCGFALRNCASRGWVSGTWLQMPIIALALLCFALAQWLGGSGFIASFVGGLTFGALTKQHKAQFLDAAEGTADAVAMVTWFTFGTAILSLLLSGFSWQVLVYALLSLTLVRMLPVFLCLLGGGFRPDTLLFMGWFGPRGLASVVFVVMVVGEKLPGNDTMVAVVVWTIVLSILLHGLSANPLAAKYGRRVDARGGTI
jgi:NhaP-type Na+/H+ or K+/H+ antiporter